MGKLFNADKQLSSCYTTQLYVDHDGFMWAATRNGLNRYDGYQTRVFKKEQGKELGMASNYVNCMLQDRHGLFYIGMYGAFQTYDGETFRDIKTYDLDGRHMPSYITCLLERKNGDILVGTSGRGLMRMTDKHEARQMGGALKDLITIHHMIEDKQQHLWIATESNGLLCYDGKAVRHYFDQQDQLGNVLDVCEDHQGDIYVGTANDGLFRIEGDKPVHIESTGNKHISALYVNHEGNIMLGYDGQGVGIYNPKTGVLKDNPYFSREVDLSTAKVYSICEDNNGNTWLGLLQKGVYMQPARTTGFKYMGYRLGARNIIGTASVTSVMISNNGYSWIGTDKDGLYCLDKSYKVAKHFKEHFPSTILGLAEDSLGRVWIGSYKEGCGWIDTRSLTYHPHSLPQGNRLSIFDLVTDARGRIWMATMGQGLLRYDIKTGDVKAYVMADNAAVDRKVNSITNNYISQISLSPDGKRIYVATSMGVCAMDIEKENWLSTFKGINTPNYGIPVRIAREYSGKVRIGTNDGLFCYDLTTHQMEHHGIESGMADNGISSIEEDHQGNLWIATDHGLCCVNTRTKTVNSYYVDNGLQSNEFSDGASWLASNGTLIFGGLGGVTWFDPKEIKDRAWKAEVKLTGFSVNGEAATPATMSGFWKITDTPVISSNRFTLSSGDNSFAIQLSTLTYDNPEHIVYHYRINNDEWVRLQPGINEITFGHMSPGNYNFCVVAEQNGSVTPERCFTVVIHAPWYRTPLAYCIYLLAVAALFWWYRRQHRRKEQDRLRLQEHIHAEEMADAKLKFFMNISHEVRTPMTLIVTPLLSLIKQDTDPHRRSVYETIRRNAERILGLINQMMDLRKIDKGQMQMHMCETDLVSFVGDIHTLFAQQAKTKSIRFSYDHDADELPIWIDRDYFDKVIVNILSNAFKFTPNGGEIRIRITHDQQQASISIFDNGEQIPEDKLEKIFERFYQTPSSIGDRNTGTGIGLDLTRSLVELHHGTIAAHNAADGKGCEFIVTLPLGNAHLKPEEMMTDVQEVPAAPPLIEADEEPAQQPEVMQQLPKTGHRQQLVVVEDDAEIRDYLASMLQDDYDVVTCCNGREGFTQVLKAVPNLVISDVMMPEMDGHALCSKIKSNPATSHVPVILLTAKSREEDKLEGLETGADAYIVKPFNMDILRRTIVNLIHTHTLLQFKYGRNDQLEEQVDDIQMKTPDDKLLERVMNVINKNLNNSDLNVDSIAREVGISRVHLHRKMKELTGQTPHDFIRNIRLKQAANLLTRPGMSVTEVVYACGFNNAASFSTIFKKFYGMTPREYMHEHQDRE
jgi:signal transduction histidine kinase/ligand-binding sensor domain-containing protein/DNA-binding response OmpR family regulator